LGGARARASFGKRGGDAALRSTRRRARVGRKPCALAAERAAFCERRIASAARTASTRSAVPQRRVAPRVARVLLGLKDASNLLEGVALGLRDVEPDEAEREQCDGREHEPRARGTCRTGTDPCGESVSALLGSHAPLARGSGGPHAPSVSRRLTKDDEMTPAVIRVVKSATDMLLARTADGKSSEPIT
jgi:hypothetical protein